MKSKCHAGFTGTQHGMTAKQHTAFGKLIKRLGITEFRHGDDTGADSEAHDIVRTVLPDCPILIHPPENKFRRAFKLGDHTFRPKAYLDRNHDIVGHTHCLIATPKTAEEEVRSGTWATVRYAKKIGRPVYVINPNGKVVEFAGTTGPKPLF